MLCLNTLAEVANALSDPDLDPDLRRLLARQGWRFYGHPEHHPDARLIVIHGGDTPDVINTALGFVFTGDDADDLAFDWVEDHGLWFEIVITRPLGSPVRLFVENGPGTELGIHYRCLAYFWNEEADGR
ncbi:hypothetical protein [Brevundimonas sp. 357]|uniref:hypothetical protein n=1 Tax=Brevundimonas sp. 357 TaxID=2555782 RepID=UPI000F7AF340|nr:hypothetical protein [Brevundimonas sp. 357]RSB48179.1 hypothetical protein EGK63_01645 [Brevundimonas sp. 357]